MKRQCTSFAIVALLAILAIVRGDAQQSCPPSATSPCFINGLAQPVFSGQPTMTHDVWVEVPEVDSDRDGLNDRIRVQITRPRATEFSTRLAVVLRVSPYTGGTKPYPTHDYTNIDLYEPGEVCHLDRIGPDDVSSIATAYDGTEPPHLPIASTSYQSYFLPRGFVFAEANSLGTGSSTGCPTIGGVEENLAVKAVIDWFNGQGLAHDVTGNQVQAYWTTGATTMIGTSYDGTLPIGAASLGVEGLKAIVPIAGVSSYYYHRRSYGTVIHSYPNKGTDADTLFDNILTRKHPEACASMRANIARRIDRLAGDYNAWWDERNYVKDADKFRAAVLISHGLNDFNVKPRHAARLYAALRAHSVPAKIWWNQGGHGDRAHSARQAVWRDTLNRFWSHYLYGVDNGAMDGPKATVERENNVWVDYADWPVPGATTTTFYLRPSGNNSVGRLGVAPPAPARPVFETIVDDSSIDAAVLAAAGQSQHRLVYKSDPITAAVHISGTPAVSLRLSFSRPAAIVSAMLVDYKANGNRTIVTRGWADPQNRKSPVDPEQYRLLGRDGLDSETFAIDPDRPYTISFELQPHDYVFQPGSRIGLMLYSSDQLFTQYPLPGTSLTLETAMSTLSLPVVGGAAAFVVAAP